jgi:hypothetical protein
VYAVVGKPAVDGAVASIIAREYHCADPVSLTARYVGHADVFAGYNAAVIVVGAAGAGKSYTMYGGLGDDGAGLAPRCIRCACSELQLTRRIQGVGWTQTCLCAPR